jgi:predicted acylesterase/phospholipase RssA
MSAPPASATTPAAGRPEAGGVHASTPGEGGQQEARTIGRAGEPVRALTFSSGGIETAMQLGVVHALLVSRAQPPDLVLGVSAGAVNAVALAEILQAGCDTADLNLEDRRDTLEPKVARFRQIFEDYQNCPHDLLDAMLPDAYQIDAQKPLKPLRLPVHAQAEREGRYKALNSRAGLINFYNELLRLKVPVGTIVRAVRRILGIQGAREAAREAQRTILALEAFRLLTLAGATLHQMAPVHWPFFRSAFTWRPWTVRHEEQGVTAARLIFRSRVWSQLRSLLLTTVSFLLLAAAWLMLAFVVLLVATVIGQLPLRIFPKFVASIGGVGRALRDLGEFLLASPGWFEPASRPSFEAETLVSHLPALGAIVISVIVFTLGYAMISAVVLKEPRGPALREALGATGTFLLLLAVWSVTLVAFAYGIAFLVDFALDGLDKAFPWIQMRIPGISALGVLALIFGAAALIGITLVVRRRRLPLHLLARYGLADSLLHPHPLRQFFVRLFDPGYYGPVDMDSVVERALRREEEPAPPPDKNKHKDHKKYLKDYWTRRSPPIHVALTVANVSTGKLSVLRGDVPTVDGLMAATAAAPLFPPVFLPDGLYIDAANVATQTTEALMNYLRHRLVKEATEVHVYNVASLPLSKAELDSEQPQPAAIDRRPVAGQYTQLVEVIRRALQIQRFRDAYLNQKLVNLLSRVLPPGGAVWTPPKRDEQDMPEPYVRASVYPIEPEAPLDLVKRFTRAGTPRERRRIIAETVADGCRAAVETMLSHQIRATARRYGKQVVPQGDGTQALPCASVIAAHNLTMNEKRGFPGSAALPGKDEEPGPGLVEVCSNCALHRGCQDTRPRHLVVPRRRKAPPDWHLGDRITHEHPARLSDVTPLPLTTPATRVEDNGGRQTVPSSGQTRAQDEQETVESLRAWHGHRQELGKVWPRTRGDARGGDRATVSLLFSGGVFRGVYQMGVLNALNMAGMRPDLIAGASVGSITAAMVARVFREPHEPERMARIARLAATYLALDRLILTDRFADFIRGFTVRAAETRFSLSQMDRVFRNFDRPSPDRYNRELRAVAAGLERLFYVSPFELRELVVAARLRKPSKVFRLLADDLQEWLSRMGVGNQVLGAEPLAQLIAEHVLDGLPGYSPEHPGGVAFDVFCEDGIYFLATATNLGRGRLEVLGERPDRKASESRATLLDALLASSAFPGVFRPRWAWEVRPGAESADQYIDGGVTDNLPLDAVAQFLHRASLAGMVAARPGQGQTPHLLLCASLEPRLTVLNAAEQKAVCYNWPGLWRRAAQLGYNKKIDLYSEIQQAIRQVMRASTTHPASWTPLDLEVMAIKPEWLCSTFGFHPMLGFRRKRQAMSIAHGCASTLLELARPRPDDQSGSWKAAWGIDENRIPEPAVANRPDSYVPLKVGKDECWFKPGVICPFSHTGLSGLGLTEQTHSEVETIYTLCGRHETHRPTI